MYRVGGRYDREIRRIVGHLTDALPYAPPRMAEALTALIRFYETGEEADRIAYDIAWVRDQESPVDTINGFVEVYLDPRGVKGAWEGMVCYVNPEKTRRIRALAAHAQWFEDHMPWDPRFRKAAGHRRDGARDRSRDRDRRLRAGDADRHQPAERPGDSRAVRQQVGVAGQRRRGLRALDAGRPARWSSPGTRPRPAARKRGARSRRS